MSDEEQNQEYFLYRRASRRKISNRKFDRTRVQQQKEDDVKNSRISCDSGHVQHIRRLFEHDSDRFSKSTDLSDLPIASGHVSNLKDRYLRSVSEVYDQRIDVSLDRWTSYTDSSANYTDEDETISGISSATSDSHVYEDVTNENLPDENGFSSGKNNSYEDVENVLTFGMNDLNVYENVSVNLPFMLPVGETSDDVDENIYEDVNFTQVESVDVENDDFGFEGFDNGKNVLEAYNNNVQVISEPSENKARRQLLECMKELIQTEINYVEKLEMVIDHFVPELENNELLKQRTSELKDFTKENLFGNLEEIHFLHKNFILKKFQYNDKNLREMVNVLIENETSLELYVFYSMNFKRADLLLRSHPEFFEKKQKELNIRARLNNYLFEPVQRLPRYQLLLDNLKKCYGKYCEATKSGSLNPSLINEYNSDYNSDTDSFNDEDDETFGVLNEALTIVKNVLRKSNESVIVSNIKNPLLNLTKQGYLLRHDEFVVTNQAKKRLNMRCFLFESIVVFTIIDRSNPKDETYNYYDAIPMNLIGITPPKNKKSGRFCLWLHKRNVKIFYLEGDDSACGEWIRIISDLLFEEAICRKEMIKPVKKSLEESYIDVNRKEEKIESDHEEVPEEKQPENQPEKQPEKQPENQSENQNSKPTSNKKKKKKRAKIKEFIGKGIMLAGESYWRTMM